MKENRSQFWRAAGGFRRECREVSHRHESCVVGLPNFERFRIVELLRLAHGNSRLDSEFLQRVHLRIRRIYSRGWRAIDRNDLVRSGMQHL